MSANDAVGKMHEERRKNSNFVIEAEDAAARAVNVLDTRIGENQLLDATFMTLVRAHQQKL